MILKTPFLVAGCVFLNFLSVITQSFETFGSECSNLFVPTAFKT